MVTKCGYPLQLTRAYSLCSIYNNIFSYHTAVQIACKQSVHSEIIEVKKRLATAKEAGAWSIRPEKLWSLSSF